MALSLFSGGPFASDRLSRAGCPWRTMCSGLYESLHLTLRERLYHPRCVARRRNVPPDDVADVQFDLRPCPER